MVYLITGGARSGKSHYAEALAKHLGGDDVLYIATLSASDEEMRWRIQKHQEQRPKTWKTLEEPLAVDKFIHRATSKVVLLDCLSGWVSNHLLGCEMLSEGDLSTVIHKAVDNLVDNLVQSTAYVIVVTNEVGSSVVPAYPLGRYFRDALGSSNQRLAKVAQAVALMTVGIPQILKGHFPELEL